MYHLNLQPPIFMSPMTPLPTHWMLPNENALGDMPRVPAGRIAQGPKQVSNYLMALCSDMQCLICIVKDVQKIENVFDPTCSMDVASNDQSRTPAICHATQVILENICVAEATPYGDPTAPKLKASSGTFNVHYTPFSFTQSPLLQTYLLQTLCLPCSFKSVLHMISLSHRSCTPR